MSKFHINRNNYERCLLTDMCPYETPLLFSNWGSYNYCRHLRNISPPTIIRKIFEIEKYTIPYQFQYLKNKNRRRTLSLIHPGHSQKIISLYKNYETLIINLCKKSSYSIRFPHSIAKLYRSGRGKGSVKKRIEIFDENSSYASSYFSYMYFPHLHKYFESDEFTYIEKKYNSQKHLDISKCFPSIYTHSLSWAIRGKSQTKDIIGKDESFGSDFDELMQNINYKETNGIVIGPELSRIFSELILQEIDKKVECEMSTKGHIHYSDYQCSRYIDDYYIYFNDDKVSNAFEEILVNELEKFKLYLNAEKIETKIRPFISNISIKKLEISSYVTHLVYRIRINEPIKKHKEINKIREIYNTDPEENYALTNFFISALYNNLNKISDKDEDKIFELLDLFITITFYLLNMDLRVSSIYKLIKIVRKLLDKIEELEIFNQLPLKDRIFHETTELVYICINNNSSIELMNLIILLSSFDDKYSLDNDLIDKVINCCMNKNRLDDRNLSYLDYFEVTSLLYYIRDNSKYLQSKERILSEVTKQLENYCVLKYSESAYLFFDIISCPFVHCSKKKELIKCCIDKIDYIKKSPEEINRIQNFIEGQSWFFNWNCDIPLEKLLKKKEYMLSY